MPISGDRHEFTQGNVDLAPERPGVYALYDGLTLTYIGKADRSIRARLQAHKRGDSGSCTQRATHYRREVHSNPPARERELLREYQQEHGRLPRCNEVMP